MKNVLEYKEFCKRIDVEFKDINILINAFTHRSYINENKEKKLSNNERLEFLGDAILEFIISDYLYKQYTDKNEGKLTSIRAAVVRTESLAREAKNLDFGELILMSKGEEQTGGKTKDYILANTFEAVLGAIYIDCGMDDCVKFLEKYLLPHIAEIEQNSLDIDSKSRLQEITQAVMKATPYYKLVKEEGPDHEKRFTMSVNVGQKELGVGTGNSKQRAEENAAQNALEKISNDKFFISA